ncbi:hypothetical protein NDU88_005915 [Pleurodeles waltl]|uniref:Uncharacterized protein n=1 Tax=Pleurodeles waltl TaxID=8319 RepID=A0AAV7SN28_PLEWA|nr:hypothetical protein NDU88_005915 [Pleurodeles waltl]
MSRKRSLQRSAARGAVQSLGRRHQQVANGGSGSGSYQLRKLLRSGYENKTLAPPLQSVFVLFMLCVVFK